MEKVQRMSIMAEFRRELDIQKNKKIVYLPDKADRIRVLDLPGDRIFLELNRFFDLIKSGKVLISIAISSK